MIVGEVIRAVDFMNDRHDDQLLLSENRNLINIDLPCPILGRVRKLNGDVDSCRQKSRKVCENIELKPKQRADQHILGHLVEAKVVQKLFTIA